MDLDVVFLGTAASMPTAQRSPAALLVRRGSERLLFDCGEGTVGVPDGAARGRLQGGDGVTGPSGRTVTPADVLGDPRPGRKIVLTGDTAPSPLVVQAAHNADLLVHEASFLADEEERARETMHSTAAQAAEVASVAKVRLLALTH